MNKLFYKLFNDKLLIIFFTIFSVIFINRYEFGVDYSVLLPFVKKIINPELYPSDYFIEQMKYYPTLLWYIVGYLCRVTHIKLEIFLIILYFISIYFFFLSFYLLAKIISKKNEIAILSLFFLLFSKESFALIETIPTSFYNRTPVLPILIFSIYHFLKKNYYFSYILLGIGFLIHPMSAFYVASMIIVATLFEIKYIGFKRLLLCFLILIIISLPVIIWGLHNNSLLSFFPDKIWLELLRLRSSHHIFPFSWDKTLYMQSFLFVIGFFLTWFKKPDKEIHINIVIFTIVIISLCLIGTIFTEIIPVTPILNLQLFRSYIYIIFIGLIYTANFFADSFSDEKNNTYKLLSVFIIFLVLFNGKNWEIGFLIILFFSLFLFLFRVVNKKIFPLNLTSFIIPFFVLIVSLYSLIFNTKKQKNFWNIQWTNIQEWARENTGINDVFVVPPHLWGFRVYSERSIYTDWKDGTMLNFNPEFGYEWIRRMKNIGFKNKNYLVQGYNRLGEEKFLKIAEEIFNYYNSTKMVYVVVYKSKILNFEQVYNNNLFTIYKINR